MRIVNYIIFIGFIILMVYASTGFPNRGDTDAVVNQKESITGSTNAAAYYITHAKKDAHTNNIVTVILADYRGYDTLGEETVILAAGLICFLLLRRREEEE